MTFLRTIADAVPCLMAYWDRNLLCSFANKAYSEWFGRPLERIIGESMQSLLGDHVFSLNLPHIDAVLAGQEQKFERVFTKADGTVTHAWVSYIPHRAPDGTTCGFIVLVTDITDLRRADQRSAESESRYRLLADQSSDMIFQLDQNQVRRYVSPASREILGYEPHELVGLKPVSQVHPDDAERVSGVFRSLIDGSVERTSVTNRIRHRDGHWVWVEVEFRSIRDQKTGVPAGIIGAMRNISLRKSLEIELAAAHRRLEAMARQDALTGLANRRTFDEMLPQYYRRARQGRESFTIVMIDVDRFKFYNDRYGHPEGDDCLRQVGAAIAASIRQTRDIAARYGGEEFALLLPETDEDSAVLVADRIRQNVERLALEHKDSPYGIVTISAGVCSLASDATDEGPDTLLRSADLALYAAKTAGRNLVARSSTANAALAPGEMRVSGRIVEDTRPEFSHGMTIVA